MSEPWRDSEIEAQILKLERQRDDLLDVVLRGHLLIEEMLGRALAPWFPQRAYLNEANLNFHRKVCLVRAFNMRHVEEPIWRAVLALNTLRNDFAHRLTSAQREERILRFIEVTDSDFMRPLPAERRDHLTERQRLALAIAYLLSSLNQICLEYDSRARLGAIAARAVLREQYGWTELVTDDQQQHANENG